MSVLKGSLSARTVERHSPWLAGLHRISTGLLLGLGVATVGLSGLTVHWQNQWTRNYAQLEASKTLEHRLQESTALLEQHHLGAIRRPDQLVPTSSENLIHLASPQSPRFRPQNPLFARIHAKLMPAGY